MKRIYLLRHGKSEKRDAEKQDFERTLTPQGREDSARIGAEMKKASLIPDRITSSDAVRAMETARICAEECEYDEDVYDMELLYTASAEDYLEILRDTPDGLRSVLIVGHNPTIEEFNESLMGRYRKIKTSNLVWYDVEINNWNEMSFDVNVARTGMLVP